MKASAPAATSASRARMAALAATPPAMMMADVARAHGHSVPDAVAQDVG